MPHLSENLLIDRDALDNELVRQPQLFYEAAEAYAQAVSARDGAKKYLMEVDAELGQELREDLAAEGGKVTEKAIEQALTIHKRHKQAVANLLELSRDADEAGALKEAFSQRAYALKDLASLFVAGYFQTSSVKGGDTQKVQEAQATHNRQRMNRQRLRLKE